MANLLRLGVNIDHVATVRNARGGLLPDPVRAAKLAIAAGASDGLGFGHNARAALITRGLAEMTRLGLALGALLVSDWGMETRGAYALSATIVLVVVLPNNEDDSDARRVNLRRSRAAPSASIARLWFI